MRRKTIPALRWICCWTVQPHACTVRRLSQRKATFWPAVWLPAEFRVRVSSFCSLRGYTVVRILKDFSEKNAERKIFNYFAAGWNRDGLALRMAGKLLDTAPADRHLLILLTDASPDDSRKILPTGKVPLSRSYDGEAGVQDTAEEVRALRQQGVRVAAVFMGENASAPDARTIYGQDLVRIQRMDQLATAAGKLIQEEIRELSG